MRIRRKEEPSGESCTHLIHFSVENANRMAPILEKKEFVMQIGENIRIHHNQTHFLTKLEARDSDFGEFGRLSYIIDNANVTEKELSTIFDYFNLDEQTGVLTLKRSINREEHDRFDIPVKVVDGGGLSTRYKLIAQDPCELP